MKVIKQDEVEISFRKRSVANVKLFISQATLESMIDHGEEDLDVEVMGLMTGRVFRDDDGTYAIINGVLRSALISDEYSVKFDKSSTDKLFDGVDSMNDDDVIAGWYHTHPGFGCFMSDTDQKTHQGIFGNDCGFAVVIDPLGQEIKAFGQGSEEIMFIIMEN